MKRMEERLSITQAILKAKASHFFIRMPMYAGQEEPKWSTGWLRRFELKYGIAKQKKHGELASAIAINCDEEIEAIQKQLLEYALCDIYNCDETGLFFKAVPDSSLSTKPVPGQKIKKDRITIMHTCSADSERLKIWMIGKSKTPRCFKNIKIKNLRLFWRNNKKAWMNTELMMEYLKWFDKEMAGRQVY
jgi:hypothetical protein